MSYTNINQVLENLTQQTLESLIEFAFQTFLVRIMSATGKKQLLT